MSGSTFGTIFRVTTAGESHGPANVVIVDGVPAGLELAAPDLTQELMRRRPGQSHIVSQRKEPDTPEILSGVFEGKTTGTPIAVLVRNQDQKSRDYDAIKNVYRPGHADYTFDAKFGRRDYRGGGRASARETVSRVVAGAIGKKLLRTAGVEIVGFVKQVGEVCAKVNHDVTLEEVERSVVRCPDESASARMEALIQKVRGEGDSIGGVAEFIARGVPRGLGEPVFDKLRADLGKALLSLPAVMGIEFGSGFSAATMRGSEHNDVFRLAAPSDDIPTLSTTTNHHGGMLGGISSGMPIVVRTVVKATSSIPKTQNTIDTLGQRAELSVRGRHDPCLLPRFIPMGEAMMAITLADHLLRSRSARM